MRLETSRLTKPFCFLNIMLLLSHLHYGFLVSDRLTSELDINGNIIKENSEEDARNGCLSCSQKASVGSTNIDPQGRTKKRSGASTQAHSVLCDCPPFPVETNILSCFNTVAFS